MDDESQVNKILNLTKQLRQSRDAYTSQVYIMAHQTRAERQAAYEERCRRRQQAATRQQDTTCGNHPLSSSSSSRADLVPSLTQSTMHLQSGASASGNTSTRQPDEANSVSHCDSDSVIPNVAGAAVSRRNDDVKKDVSVPSVSALHATFPPLSPMASASGSCGNGVAADTSAKLTQSSSSYIIKAV